MKTLTRAAALAAALTMFASASSAFAADSAKAAPTGHYEWRAQPNYGPRAPTRAPIRIWVSDSKAMAAECDCAMMHESAAQAADCMTMPMKDRSSSRG